MLKKTLIVILAIGLMMTTTACGLSKSTTEKYIEALNMTQNAEDLQVKTQIAANLDLSKAEEKTKQDFDKFTSITINTDQWIDNKNKRSETQNFVKAGELLLDSKIFVNGDNIYFKSSFTDDKYFNLTAQAPLNAENSLQINTKEQETFCRDLQEIWKSSVGKEILSKEGNSIENTPDGDIKVSILTLELNDEKSKLILKKIADLVAKNDSMTALISQNGAMYSGDNLPEVAKKRIQDWLHKLPETMQTNIDKFEIVKLKLTAKVDKDSHIIDETLEGTVVIKIDGEIKANFNVHTTRWNIDSGKVKVNLPQITNENLIEGKDMKLNNSEMIKKFTESIRK